MEQQRLIQVPFVPASINRLKPRSAKVLAILSCLQIAIGGLCILFGIAEIVMVGVYDGPSPLAYSGYPIWIGSFYLVVGVVGLCAARNNTSDCRYNATMVLNIICAVLPAGIHISFAVIDMSEAVDVNDCNFDPTSAHCVWSESFWNTFVALDALMVIMAFTQFVISIILAAMSCKATCRCCNPTCCRCCKTANRQLVYQPVQQYGSFQGGAPHLLVLAQGQQPVGHYPQQFNGAYQQQFSGVPQQQFSGVPQQQFSGVPQQQFSGVPQQQFNWVPQQQVGVSSQQTFASQQPQRSSANIDPQPIHPDTQGQDAQPNNHPQNEVIQEE